MTVNTKQVQGRRTVRYESLDELLADAQRLASTEVTTLGNWSQGQIYEHLARSLNSSIDGAGFAFPSPLRWIMSTFMKRRFLTQSIPPGFKPPAKGQKFIPDATSLEAGLASLEAAIERQKNESARALHPGFGRFTREEWDQFNLRHAELHMSFLINGDA